VRIRKVYRTIAMAIMVPRMVAAIVAVTPTMMLLPNDSHTRGSSQMPSQLSSVKPRHTMLVRRASLNENTIVYTIGIIMMPSASSE